MATAFIVHAGNYYRLIATIITGHYNYLTNNST